MRLTSSDKRILKAMTSFPWKKQGGPSFYDLVEDPHRRDPAKYGIARRALDDDPTEIVRFACLGTRDRWRAYLLNPDGESASLWHTCLWAMAINDTVAVERILRDAPRTASESPSAFVGFYRIFYNLFFGIVRSEELLARDAAELLSKQRLSTNNAAIADCLIAIFQQSSSRFSAALEDVCTSIRRIRAMDPHYKLVDVIAHGLWELAHSRSPELVESWDAERALPWDAELHAWRRKGIPAIDTIDFSLLSEAGRQALEMPAQTR